MKNKTAGYLHKSKALFECQNAFPYLSLRKILWWTIPILDAYLFFCSIPILSKHRNILIMNSQGLNKQSLRWKQWTIEPDPTGFGQLNLVNIGYERCYTPSHSFLGAEL